MAASPSGSSVCPSSIPARRAVVERAADAVCSATDDDGSPLLRTSNDGNFVTCVYRDAGTCTYFEVGSSPSLDRLSSDLNIYLETEASPLDRAFARIAFPLQSPRLLAPRGTTTEARSSVPPTMGTSFRANTRMPGFALTLRYCDFF